MALKLLNPSFKSSFNQRFREKRFQFFLSLISALEVNRPIKILDVGGTEIYWENMNFINRNNFQITLLNLEKVDTKHDGFESVKGDACDLHFYKDKEFDIVFSNSVIEHLFSKENQRKMANEIMRVGKYYYIQTPNYYFPIEPHWLFPFFQFFPFRLKVFLTKNFDLGHYEKSVTKDKAINRVKEVKLLTEKEMKELFPNGKVNRERFMGLVKSLTMYHFPEK